ncbi:MAG: cytochrome c-type biogenesis protein CcmH [Gammaproteobacteria bacterium]|nr:cytochrome c-type biogenesis protein CcmH [Gammaproteobacteria bacterium]
MLTKCRIPFIVLILVVLTLAAPVSAAEPLVKFDTEVQAAHYDELVKRYRCLKCQNQNLADSPAGLADDLRREIAAQITQGKSTHEIDDYLVQRYGEFVLYKPRLKPSTWVLWLGPFLLLFVAGWGAFRMIRRPKVTDDGPSRIHLSEAKNILKD